MDTNHFKGIYFNNGFFSEVSDVLATEEALTVSVNEVQFTVTMRTPGNETELLQGLLYTEGIYKNRLEPLQVRVTQVNSKGYITQIDLQLPEDQILKNFEASRNIISASSCGLCGRTSFEETISSNKIANSSVLNPVLVSGMFASMKQLQHEFKVSGGTHAAAAFDLQGNLLSVFEDIGRHNAVDKLIGDLIQKNVLQSAAVVTVSGRVSYEIVNKVVAAGIPFLAAVSAPSSMAVEMAEAAGLTLLAFCRDGKLTIYSNPEHMIQSELIQKH